jgi:hypothetical protein
MPRMILFTLKARKHTYHRPDATYPKTLQKVVKQCLFEEQVGLD